MPDPGHQPDDRDPDEIDRELERILAQRAGELTADPTEATPVTVLTGFLGAGKTTLANRILSEDHGRRIAVLVNDFGEIDIDSELILGVETGQVTLANGCVCCEIRDDLIAAVDRVLDGPDLIDAIVLEASGVAEPMGVARTFLEAANANRVRLDGIISVVDAEQLPAQTADPVTAELVYGQIGCSDLVLLNKIDLADRPRVDEVRSFVTERLPTIRIIETTHADVPLAVVLGGDDDPRAAALDDTHGHSHDHGFTSWVYRRDHPVDPDRMRAAISRLPGSVYRVKGFAPATTDPGRRWLIQAVGMRADVIPFDDWDDRTPRTALVVIAADHVDRDAVERALDEGLLP